MYPVQMDKTIQQIIELFYRFGLWQSDEESTFRKTGKKIFFSIFLVLLPIFYITNAFLCDDLNESIFLVQVAVAAVVVYVKCLYLLFKKQEVLTFLYDEIVIHSAEFRESNDNDQTNKKIKTFTKIIRAYFWMIIITLVLVIVIPLPVFSTVKALPLFISFSWNDSETMYWLAYLFVSLSGLLYFIADLVTAPIWYIMLNYSIEYQLLGKKFRKLGVGKIVTKTGAVQQKTFNSRATDRSRAPRIMFVEDLIVLIKAHQNLTSTIERFKSFFSPLFLVQITTSGIVMCVSLYCLAFGSNVNIFQTELYLGMLAFGLFDIFVVMYLGNEITDSGDRLCYCLFESNWVEQTKSCKKYVLIMGEVLKQQKQMVILIYPMNLETFTSILNGGYSMFNILKSFQ